MLYTNPDRIYGKHMLAGHKPVLHYVKQHYRKIHSSPMPDVWHSEYDKSEHAWSQGSGGVEIPITHLTNPGELIVDGSPAGSPGDAPRIGWAAAGSAPMSSEVAIR